MSEVVTMRELLECGVHFGHQTKRWDPRMKKYIFTSRNDIHVIDLQQTVRLVKRAYQFAKEIVANNGSILFVGTKKQAQDAIAEESRKVGMPFVNHRWLGGTLTNFVTIRQSVTSLRVLTRMEEDGSIDTLSKKEAARKRKRMVRLEHYLGGIKDMSGLPSALFIVDVKKEQLAVAEANKLGIPIIGIVDTNANPNEIQYPIPANDDAIRAVRLMTVIMARAVAEGQATKANKNGEGQPKVELAEFEANAAEPVAIEAAAVTSAKPA